MINFTARSLMIAAFAFFTAACGSKGGGGGDSTPQNTATTPLTTCSEPGYMVQNNQCVPGATINPQSCNGGIFHPQYGCIPHHNSCPQGYGFHQNNCYPPPLVNLPNQYGYSCQGSCGVGQVQTMYGCLPQCNVQGYNNTCGGMINGACIPGYTDYYGQGSYGYPTMLQGQVYFWYPNSWGHYKPRFKKWRW